MTPAIACYRALERRADSDIAAKFKSIKADCTKCAVRDANCCALAECPFLSICPVFRSITGVK